MTCTMIYVIQVIFFIEECIDRAALDAHVQSAHFQRLVPLIDQYARQEGIFTHMQHYQELF